MPPAAAARRALLAPFAIAATVAVATSGTPVRAIDSCVLPSVESLSFGPYDPLLGAPVDGTGSVTYYCTGAAETITVTIDRGASTSFWPRHMTSAGGTLDYNLYLDRLPAATGSADRRRAERWPAFRTHPSWPRGCGWP